MSIPIFDQIWRHKIYESKYWKFNLFSVNCETIIDKAIELKYIGSVIPSANIPTDFVCLVLKLHQLKPSEEILEEFLSIPEYKYLRALTVLYIRLTFPAVKVYQKLERWYSDYRKLCFIDNTGKFSWWHMDEFIEILLTKNEVFDITLPQWTKRKALEDNKLLEIRVSVWDEELKNNYEKDREINDIKVNECNNKEDDKSRINEEEDADDKEEAEDDDDEDVDIFADIKLPNTYFTNKKRERDGDNNPEIPEIVPKETKTLLTNTSTQKTNSNDTQNIAKADDLKELDPNSTEYWLALRKKIGLN